MAFEDLDFQILVTAGDQKELLEGLMLPKNFTSFLPPDCTSLKLVDYDKKKYYVCIYKFGGPCYKIYGGQWSAFVKSRFCSEIAKFCFTWIKKRTFLVDTFSPDGHEFRKSRDSAFINSCLMVASEATFVKQAVYKLLLWDLNENEDRESQTSTTISGKRCEETVEIFHDYTGDGIRSLAAGFEGIAWTNLCCKNNLQVGYIMRLTNLKNLSFKIDIFNSEGIGLDAAVLSNEEDNEHEMNSLGNDVERVNITNHTCRYKDYHQSHSDLASLFFQTIEYHSVVKPILVVPKYFVRLCKLFTYERAVIRHREMLFSAYLHLCIDRQINGDESYLFVSMDWSAFMEQTGINPCDLLRFQLIANHDVLGEVIELEVC